MILIEENKTETLETGMNVTIIIIIMRFVPTRISGLQLRIEWFTVHALIRRLIVDSRVRLETHFGL